MAGLVEFPDPGQQIVALDVGHRHVESQPVGEGADLVGQPAGLSPPALVTTLMPRSMQVPSTSSIWVRKVWAQPFE